ncbi:MAG: SET domain-containing protein-lysine N-methyltransferase [Nitrospirae bacterium]|nr:SET domain-containing protein-lysine N-methyltransferase [Nitrospirota bacterium]
MNPNLIFKTSASLLAELQEFKSSRVQEFAMDNPILEIRETARHDMGSFACQQIAQGQVIKVLDGEVLTFAECTERIKSGAENIDDPLQIEDDLFLDLDELSRVFNHSCDPNSGMRKKSELFALRDIMPGEEITFDYSAVVGINITPDMWTMECNCGAKNCRKRIGNILSIPEDQIGNYIQQGALQDYIKVQLKAIGYGL